MTMSKNKIDMEALARDLQNMGAPKRSRFVRFLKWLIFIILLLLIAGGGYVAWYFHQLTGNHAYRQAMEKIQEDPEIKAQLGEPIQLVYIKPAPSFAKDGDNLDIWWSVEGPEKKQAKVHIKTRFLNKQYETVGCIEVLLPDNKKILLAETGGDADAPAFNPGAAPAPNTAPDSSAPLEKPAEDLPEELMPKIPQVNEEMK
jgi:hypothetical protein